MKYLMSHTQFHIDLGFFLNHIIHKYNVFGKNRILKLIIICKSKIRCWHYFSTWFYYVSESNVIISFHHVKIYFAKSQIRRQNNPYIYDNECKMILLNMTPHFTSKMISMEFNAKKTKFFSIMNAEYNNNTIKVE